MELLDIAIPLVVATGVSAAATPLISKLASAFDVIDRPNDRKVNRRSNIPLMGGVAVALGFATGLGAAVVLLGDTIDNLSALDGYIVGASILLVAGVLDDRFNLRARHKLVIQIVAAAAAVYFGFQIKYVTEPLTTTTFYLPPWVSWPATIIWIVGVTNAINLLDGLDGLATGLGAIIGITLTVIGLQTGSPLGVALGVSLVGALLGFLPFNFAPAKIFLGDTGSLFIGFTLSLLALECYRTASLLTFVVPLLALAVPLIDTALSIFRRLRQRRPTFDTDRMHMHHRL
ncbi:MAG: undecaprenyl/decaprenyl-phosphate alpha-N-acetylglucosaminyl 1-phosphate transferase, partial [Proteobacteria bacterium]|nr:undecaprenyl/decaprenyl-phosphate alpha-N-acetylglucosaminyl 1-phosphate transferase [Pseudomonadota bacterium]